MHALIEEQIPSCSSYSHSKILGSTTSLCETWTSVTGPGFACTVVLLWVNSPEFACTRLKYTGSPQWETIAVPKVLLCFAFIWYGGGF